ncbi:MAG: hypothetical protein ABI435_09770 [Pseudolysinimonas sp.]
MSDAVEPRKSAWSRLPRWGRIGLIAAVVVVLTLVGIVGFRILSKVPNIPLGVTAVGDLRDGSCLAEDGRDLAEYTVVPCTTAHPQQLFATADLDLADVVYAREGSALDAFGDSVCGHFLEYRLFLMDHLRTNDYIAYAIDVPTPDEYLAGHTNARCAIASTDRSNLTTDLYRQMP